MSDYTKLLAQLADVGDEHLDQLVKDAKKLRAKNLRDKIPQALKDSLVRKHDRMFEGQTTALIIKPELCFTFTVKAGGSDWTDFEWGVQLVNDDDKRAVAFFELFDLNDYIFDDCQGTLPKLEPHLNVMLEQEEKVRESWQDDYHHLRSEFGVNAYDLVEELKKEDQQDG